MKIFAIIIVIAVILGGGYALIKHNNDNKTSTTYSSTSTSSSNSSSSSSKSPSATNAVEISNYAFNSSDITVKKGTTVTWTNKDAVAHTVTETDGQTGPKSQDLNQGQSYSFTFSDTGTFKYACSIHPNMTGSVTVTE